MQFHWNCWFNLDIYHARTSTFLASGIQSSQQKAQQSIASTSTQLKSLHCEDFTSAAKEEETFVTTLEPYSPAESQGEDTYWTKLLNVKSRIRRFLWTSTKEFEPWKLVLHLTIIQL